MFAKIINDDDQINMSIDYDHKMNKIALIESVTIFKDEIKANKIF